MKNFGLSFNSHYILANFGPFNLYPSGVLGDFFGSSLWFWCILEDVAGPFQSYAS